MGGKNKVSMSALKEALFLAGFENPESYINSGNLFFSSAESREACILKIRKVLEINYDFSIPFGKICQGHKQNFFDKFISFLFLS